MLALNQYRVCTYLSYTDANEIPNFLQLSRCTRADLSQRDTESLGLNLLSQSQSEQSQCSPACWYFTCSGVNRFGAVFTKEFSASDFNCCFGCCHEDPIQHTCKLSNNKAFVWGGAEYINSCGTSKSWLENIVCIVSNIVCNIPTFYFSLPSLILTEKSGFWHASHK